MDFEYPEGATPIDPDEAADRRDYSKLMSFVRS